MKNKEKRKEEEKKRKEKENKEKENHKKETEKEKKKKVRRHLAQFWETLAISSNKNSLTKNRLFYVLICSTNGFKSSFVIASARRSQTLELRFYSL